MNKKAILKTFVFWAAACLSDTAIFAQAKVSGRIIDGNTRALLSGVYIHAAHSRQNAISDQSGRFTIEAAPRDSFLFSCAGYNTLVLRADSNVALVELMPLLSQLQGVVVTASGTQHARTDEAAAIATISPKTIKETNPTKLNELLDKVPGVIMQDLGNEQHAMSIRQPMTTSPYFLYLEDGVPIAPVGNFNHNQLIEVNMLGIRSIEVLKGPGASLYGSNAIGGVINFITQSPSFTPTAKVGVQVNNYGYERLEFYAGNYLTDKLGISVGGYMARQRSGWQQYSDFDKLSLSLKMVYNLSAKIKLTGYVTANDLYTQTGGSIDSAGFYSRKYLSSNNFSYRKVHARRAKITLDDYWNADNKSTATFYYGNNAIGQIPRYRIKNIDKQAAAGEENLDSYNSYGLILQHTTKLHFLNSAIAAGASADYAPDAYNANYLAIARDTLTGYYTSFQDANDSMLADYKANLFNTAAWLQYELMPLKNLKIIMGIRCDFIQYGYINHLNNSGVPDTVIKNTAVAPRLGIVYDLGNSNGLYANYSRGFSPPQISDLFAGTSVPRLKPAYFDNYEVGGWAALCKHKLYIDISLYQLNGNNEIVSLTLPDNVTVSKNVGRTLHRGVEYSITYMPVKDIFVRLGGTNAIHKYIHYAVRQLASGETLNYDGREMPEAPHFIANAELTLTPSFIRGFRISLEWQRLSPWFKDDLNRFQYADKTFLFKGVSLLNLRAGYRFKNVEIYSNLLNLTNELYANGATRSENNKESYSAGAPRTVAFGFIYHFGN